MGVDLRKIKINDRLCNAVTFEEYSKDPRLYDKGYTAIITDDLVLPIINSGDKTPGVLIFPDCNIGCLVNTPEDADYSQYSKDNLINLSDAKSMRELVATQNYVRSLENDILTSSDNIFTPKISEEDTPEMKAFKEAVIAKQIDINSYAPRMGENFGNNKRLFNGGSITFKKMREIAHALDIKVTISVEDANGNVCNPIGRVISADVTDSYDENE